jgi:hypothetical protein
VAVLTQQPQLNILLLLAVVVLSVPLAVRAVIAQQQVLQLLQAWH